MQGERRDVDVTGRKQLHRVEARVEDPLDPGVHHFHFGTGARGHVGERQEPHRLDHDEQRAKLSVDDVGPGQVQKEHAHNAKLARAHWGRQARAG